MLRTVCPVTVPTAPSCASSVYTGTPRRSKPYTCNQVYIRPACDSRRAPSRQTARSIAAPHIAWHPDRTAPLPRPWSCSQVSAHLECLCWTDCGVSASLVAGTWLKAIDRPAPSMITGHHSPTVFIPHPQLAPQLPLPILGREHLKKRRQSTSLSLSAQNPAEASRS